MNHENAFFAFLKARKEVFFVGFLLLLGIALLILGSTGGLSTDKAEDEEVSLTEQVKSLLSGVKGVGEVEVLILYETEEKTASFGGNGNTSEKVVSVSVVCDGGDNPQTQAEITKMLTSLFGIGANRVTVLKRKA